MKTGIQKIITKKRTLYTFNIMVLVFLVSGSIWYFVLRDTGQQVEETPIQEEETSDIEDGVDYEESDTNHTLTGSLPDYLTNPRDMTFHNGILYILGYERDINNRKLWQLWQTYPLDPGLSTLVGNLPEELEEPKAITSHDGNLYVVNDVSKGYFTDPRDLWQIDTIIPKNSTRVGWVPYYDRNFSMVSHNEVLYLGGIKGLWQIYPSDPGKIAIAGNLPIDSRSIISHNGDLYAVAVGEVDRGPKVRKINLIDPESSTFLGFLPMNRTAIASHDGAFYVLSSHNEIWIIDINSLEKEQ